MMSRSTLISEILLEGEVLDIGESVRLNCPKCAENTFTITRSDQGVLYNCYRNSCDCAGFVGIDKIARERMGMPKKKQRIVRFYKDAIHPLTNEQREYLINRFSIEHQDITIFGIRYAPDVERFVLPIFNLWGYERGMDLHRWQGTHKKSIVYAHDPCGAMSSWHGRNWTIKHTVVVVEDIMSAIRCSRLANTTGLALLGTGLGPDKLQEIMDAEPFQVIVALDADATKAAYDMVWDNKLLFRRIRNVTLKRDLKDARDDDEVWEALYG